MRFLSLTAVPALLAGLIVAGAAVAPSPCVAQSAPEPAAKAPPKSVAKAKAKAEPKAQTKTAARPPAEAAPEPEAKPSPIVRPKAEEAQHGTRLDTAIAVVRELTISPADASSLKEAIAAATGGKPQDAKAARNRIGDPSARKIVDWYLYRGGYGTPAEIRAFLDANPAWPERGLIVQRAEVALLTGNASPADIKALFAGTEPRTAIGLSLLAPIYLAEGDEAKARALAQKAWIDHDIPASLEAAFLQRVGKLLDVSDHKRRLDRLLLAASRSTSERNERAVIVRRVIALLPEAEKKTAEARLAVFLRSKDSQKLLGNLPKHSHADWGLAVQKARALRRQKKEEEAWKILLAEPTAEASVAKPDGWWEERRTAAYAALRLGKPKTAYDLARDPGLLSVNAAKDAAFLAGWLALRHLKDPKRALDHFQALAKAADGPLSHARGQYWLGRTYETLGDKDRAQEAYRAASAFIDTFHGQLARLKVDPKARGLEIAPPASPTADEVTRFNESDAVRAAVVARKAGLDVSVARVFLSHLRHYLKSEAELAMLAHLAESLGDTQTAVRIGKTAIARGFNLYYYAYPIHSLPEYKPLRQPAETAVIFGIARQESEFNTLSMSGVGARGILQIMPATARHVCRDHNLKCDIKRLMNDPAYNTMLGSAYISDSLKEFTGSYVLAIAGYNAGPGRAREWMKEFGDPRDAKVDPIDWIHRIPFEETREYVQKVLSNIQIYRARLGEADAVRLNTDLRRVSAASAEN